MVPRFQARKKSTRINFLGPETARWGGGLPREGVGVKKFVLSLESCLPWVSKRGIWDVPGILPGCPAPQGVFKKFVQKKFVRIFHSRKLCFKGKMKLTCRAAMSQVLFSACHCKSPRVSRLDVHEQKHKHGNIK